MFVGMTFGFSLGKPIQQNFGWSGLYLTSMGIIVTNLLFVVFCVKEGDRRGGEGPPAPEKKKDQSSYDLLLEQQQIYLQWQLENRNKVSCWSLFTRLFS